MKHLKNICCNKCRVRFIFAASDKLDYKNLVKNYINNAVKYVGPIYSQIFTTETIKETSHSSVVKVYGKTDLVNWMINHTKPGY